MKISHRTLAATFGALVLGLLSMPSSSAQCGSTQPLPDHGGRYVQPAHGLLMQAAFLEEDHDADPQHRRLLALQVHPRPQHHRCRHGAVA
jgi:hypothetical protein